MPIFKKVPVLLFLFLLGSTLPAWAHDITVFVLNGNGTPAVGDWVQIYNPATGTVAAAEPVGLSGGVTFTNPPLIRGWLYWITARSNTGELINTSPQRWAIQWWEHDYIFALIKCAPEQCP